MGKYSDISGQRYGRLVALHDSGKKTSNGNHIWLFMCDCGNSVEVPSSAVKNGNTSSCGCLKTELNTESKITHGMSNTKTYSVWRQMLNRCYNEKHQSFKYYAGRGIGVCEEWKHSFQSFYADMGECPDGYSLERIDNNKGYVKDNCKWETKSRQSYNTRRRTSNTSGRTGVYKSWGV